jgi:general nucleoside transport system ATP-binding protein
VAERQVVGAGEEIHRLLLDYRARGGAVLLVSYEISELRALADRVLVMLDGGVTADLDAAEATEDVLGAAMVHAPQRSDDRPGVDA